MEKPEDFDERRKEQNELVIRYADINIKRFYNIDESVYKDGALPAKTKELLGLVASLVLRCDDCVTYHLHQCRQAGVTDEELTETLGVGLIVGGSIVIPHLRRAYVAWDEMK